MTWHHFLLQDTTAIVATVACFCIAAVAVAVLRFRVNGGDDANSVQVSQLYVYPVKSIRGSPLQKAHIGEYGMVGDRTFSLQKVIRDSEQPERITKYETLLVGNNLRMALFEAHIEYKGNKENSAHGDVVVAWHGRDTDFDVKTVTTPDTIRFPLKPDTENLQTFESNLHGSIATAYDMGDELSTWFSDRMGMETRLAFIGDGSRPVLGSLAPNSSGGLKRRRILDRVKGLIPLLAFPAERLVFNDIAHYLVVTEESNNDVTNRLADGCAMDVTKFRPNIVVKGAPAPYAEDYWGELTFEGGVQMPLTANCYRCQSITVDYQTGKAAEDDRGAAWKKLNTDRRVDKGAKYSPVFGRYGYCFGSSTGKTVSIGQKARVTSLNKQRTTFDWKLH